MLHLFSSVFTNIFRNKCVSKNQFIRNFSFEKRTVNENHAQKVCVKIYTRFLLFKITYKENVNFEGKLHNIK